MIGGTTEEQESLAAEKKVNGVNGAAGAAANGGNPELTVSYSKDGEKDEMENILITKSVADEENNQPNGKHTTG